MPCSKAMYTNFNDMEKVENDHGNGGEHDNNMGEGVDHQTTYINEHEDEPAIGDINFWQGWISLRMRSKYSPHCINFNQLALKKMYCTLSRSLQKQIIDSMSSLLIVVGSHQPQSHLLI